MQRQWRQRQSVLKRTPRRHMRILLKRPMLLSRPKAKAMEAEAIRSEEDAQKAYEDFVKETNACIEAKSKEIVNKTELKAKAESDLVEAKEAKEAVMLELEQLSNYNAELHQSCDFILKNFDIRQTARDEEIEALKQAKAILSGAKFEEFLQGA